MLPLVASHCRYIRLGASVLTAALLAGTVAPYMAHAQLVGCRSDPVVSMSDGTQLDLNAVINDSSNDVKQVIYTLHVPVATYVIAYTPGLLGSKQVVQVTADQNPKTYETITMVKTYTPGIPVTATTKGVRPIKTATASASGNSNQSLTVRVYL
jgi:hypothetical protein